MVAHRLGSVDKPQIYNNLILPVIPNLIGDPFKILNFKEIDGFPIRSGMTKTKGFISLLTFSTHPLRWVCPSGRVYCSNW